MSDFITLNCPSCGGKLKVMPTQTTLLCENCGNEHMVRRENNVVSLETFARCPKCGRNDRVEKLSSILHSQTRQASMMTEVRETTTGSDGIQRTQTRWVPTTSTETSDLVQRLSPPAKPTPSAGGIACLPVLVYISAGIILLISGACSLLSISGIFLSSTSDERWVAILLMLAMAVPGVALAVGAFFLGRKLSKNEAEDQRKKTETDRLRLADWQAAMKRWQKLYYCFRDDGVFEPGAQNFTDLEHMGRLLYSK